MFRPQVVFVRLWIESFQNWTSYLSLTEYLILCSTKEDCIVWNDMRVNKCWQKCLGWSVPLMNIIGNIVCICQDLHIQKRFCSFIFSWSHKRPISSSLCIIGFVKQASCRHYQHGTCEAFISGQRRCCSSVQSSPKLEELLCQSFARVSYINQDRETCHLLCEDAVLAQSVLNRVLGKVLQSGL